MGFGVSRWTDGGAGSCEWLRVEIEMIQCSHWRMVVVGSTSMVPGERCGYPVCHGRPVFALDPSKVYAKVGGRSS